MESGGKLLALVWAAMLVSGMIAPVTAVAGSGPEAAGNQSTPTAAAGNQPTDGSDENETISPDAPPVVEKRHAVRLVERLDVGDRRGYAGHPDRARDRFNGTLSAYDGPVRIGDTGAFTDDAVGVRALAHLAGTDASEEARRAADLVYRADNESAHVAVQDARRALDRYGDELRRGQRQAASSRLRVAERAIDRADRRSIHDGDGRRFFGSRAGAMTQLRSAHRHAQAVLRVVDAETTPSVSISRENDPIHDGNRTLHYVVRGTVSAVRPSTIESVTLTVNDGRTVQVQPNLSSATPATTADYRTTVNLTDRVNRIEVTVTDGAADGRNRPGQQETAVLRLDGDGLTQTAERSVAGTDPLDPDSDAGLTDVNEADDGVIDGREDLDDDRVPLAPEHRHGTSVTSNDTDGDGLTDAFEIWYGRNGSLDATTADTDGDGTADGAEDLDGDGLRNDREQSAVTNPVAADTDGDSLSDGAEVTVHGTDPRDTDTDGDGLSDAEEIQLGTDPLVADTDGDGVIDANEMLATRTIDPTTGTTVTASSTGYTDVDIAKQTLDADNETIRASPLVRIRSGDSVRNATVTMPYESGIDASATNLTLATWNPETTDPWQLVNSTVDETNRTVSANVSHFSYFMVVREGLWRRNLQPSAAGDDGDGSPTTPIDVMLTLDTSGSMGGGELGEAKAASTNFVGSLLDDDRAGLVGFTSNADVKQRLTRDHDAVNRSIESLDAGGGTDIAAAVDTSTNQLRANGMADHQKVVVLVSDGQSASGPALDAARRAKRNGIAVYTVAVGNGADRQLLREIAEITSGNSYFVSDASETEIAFREISEETTEFADSDDDGLPDVWETSNTPLAAGPNPFEIVVTDPKDPDTDGDGIPDGEEVQTTVVAGQLLPTAVTSDPSEANTDGAGDDDGAELSGPNPSNPLVKEWLLMGASIPSVTDGDANPVSTGEADATANFDEDLVAVSTKNANGKRGFCIKQFDDCPRDYLSGVDRRSGHSYYKIPIQVYATSNAELDAPVQWELDFEAGGGATVVQTGKTSGTIEPGEGSVQTYVTVEFCGGQSISNALSCPSGAYQSALERVGTLDVEFTNLESTRYDDHGDRKSLSQSYSISRSFTLDAVTKMLDQTEQVYGTGMTIATGATSVATLYASGASSTQIGVALFETAAGLAGAPPTDAKGVVQEGIKAGIGAFKTEVEQTREANRKQIFGADYEKQPAGAQELRVT